VNALLEAGARDGKAPVAGLEDYFNIANTRHLENLSPVLRRAGLGMVTYRPYNGGRPLGREQSDEPGTPGETLMKTLRQVSAELGRPVAQVCIAWVLSHPEITSVLTCAESPEHVEDNLAGTTLELPPEALSALNAASHALRAAQESGTSG
jgi:aryl-alcohol dehydrogenase-like predicted oxidoreductase